MQAAITAGRDAQQNLQKTATADQAVKDQTNTKLPKMPAANTAGHNAEQDAPEAATADQTVVKTEKGAELSTKRDAQTTGRKAQQQQNCSGYGT